MFIRSSKNKDRRRSRSFQPVVDTLASRIAPTVFTPFPADMGMPPLPDSLASTQTICGDDLPMLPTGW